MTDTYQTGESPRIGDIVRYYHPEAEGHKHTDVGFVHEVLASPDGAGLVVQIEIRASVIEHRTYGRRVYSPQPGGFVFAPVDAVDKIPTAPA